jgi:hypothetical protein
MNDEWKMRPYLGVLPLVLRALQGSREPRGRETCISDPCTAVGFPTQVCGKGVSFSAFLSNLQTAAALSI